MQQINNKTIITSTSEIYGRATGHFQLKVLPRSDHLIQQANIDQ